MSDFTVTSIGELINELGGPTRAAEVLGVKGPQRVVNWRRRNKITPDLFMKHQAALQKRGIVAPASFWGQT
jgi:hypothetical protein